jgi:hypothetical protein
MNAMAIIGFIATKPGATDLAVSMRKIQPMITSSGTMVGMARTNLKSRRGCDLGAEASLPVGPVGRSILVKAAPDTTPLFSNPPARG